MDTRASRASTRVMIRVAIVDDHHAVRVGLEALLRSEPGVLPVGAAERAEAVPPLIHRTQPDVVLLDYQLPDTDGLTVCRRITSDVPSPAVLIYSAFADASLIAPAFVAGAGGIMHKGRPAHDLFEAVRLAARGESAIPPVSPELLEAAALSVDPEDLPILGMLIERTPKRDIASALRCSTAQLNRRIGRMLDAMRARADASSAVAR